MRPRELIRRVALASAVVAVGAAASAESVIRDATGDVERWHRDHIDLVYSPGTLPAGFESLGAAVEGAAAAWNADSHTPRIEPRAGDPGAIGFDPAAGAANTSGVYVSTDGLPGVQGDALAVTLVTTNAQTGEILDTDVIFNARDHRFASLGPDGILGTAAAPYDVQNTLTHEFGHVLGLGEDPGHPLATMYPTSMPGEVQKRTLDGEDLSSVDAAYAQPLASTSPSVTAPATTMVGGCGGAHIAPRSPVDGTDSAWMLAAIGLCAAAFVARRASQRRLTRRPHNGWGHGAHIAAVALAASCLVGAAPDPRAMRPDEARVVSRSVAWDGHLVRTHAIARDVNGVDHAVDALGGRIGSYVMHVYGATDGAALEPGATISLSPRL